MAHSGGGGLLVLLGGLDLVVDSEVWHGVVHWVLVGLGVEVLVAAGGGADWVASHVSLHGNSCLLRWLLLRGNYVWVDIVSAVDWLWKLPLTMLLLLILHVLQGVLDVVIHSEIWHWVVDWVALWVSLPVLPLASRGWANWIALLGGLLWLSSWLGLGESWLLGSGGNWLWDSPLSVLGLQVLHMLNRCLNIVVHAEVWNWIINWVVRSCWLHNRLSLALIGSASWNRLGLLLLWLLIWGASLGSNITTILSVVSLNMGWNVPSVDSTALLALERVASWDGLGRLLGKAIVVVANWSLDGWNAHAIILTLIFASRIVSWLLVWSASLSHVNSPIVVLGILGWNIPSLGGWTLMALIGGAGWNRLGLDWSADLGSDVTTVLTVVSLNMSWDIPSIDGATVLALE